jgi:hypothetical protein
MSTKACHPNPTVEPRELLRLFQLVWWGTPVGVELDTRDNQKYPITQAEIDARALEVRRGTPCATCAICACALFLLGFFGASSLYGSIIHWPEVVRAISSDRGRAWRIHWPDTHFYCLIFHLPSTD